MWTLSLFSWRPKLPLALSSRGALSCMKGVWSWKGLRRQPSRSLAMSRQSRVSLIGSLVYSLVNQPSQQKRPSLWRKRKPKPPSNSSPTRNLNSNLSKTLVRTSESSLTRSNRLQTTT